MLPKMNNNNGKQYSLVGNYNSTYVLYMENYETPLLMSRQLKRAEMLRAIFFVLYKNLQPFYPDIDKMLKITIQEQQPSSTTSHFTWI